MRRLLYTAAFLLLLCSPVSAQTHPCDEPAQAPGQRIPVGVAFTIGWCHDGLDTNGNPATITGWRIARNGVVTPVTPTASATTNAAGLRYFTMTHTENATGTVSIEVWAVSAAGEGARGGMGYTVDPPPPPPQTVPRGPSGLRLVPNVQ